VGYREANDAGKHIEPFQKIDDWLEHLASTYVSHSLVGPARMDKMDGHVRDWMILDGRLSRGGNTAEAVLHSRSERWHLEYQPGESECA